MISAIKNPIAASFSQALVFAASCFFCVVVERGREPYAMGAIADGYYSVIVVTFLFAALYFFVSGVSKLMTKTRQVRLPQ